MKNICERLPPEHWLTARLCYYYVGNKAKVRISKQVFQENKARQIFGKTNISYRLIRSPPFGLNTERCGCGRAYQRVKNVRFLENLACFVFLKHQFWDFALLSYYRRLGNFLQFSNYMRAALPREFTEMT